MKPIKYVNIIYDDNKKGILIYAKQWFEKIGEFVAFLRHEILVEDKETKEQVYVDKIIFETEEDYQTFIHPIK